jgi:16S rRNA U516 pseudouridylate synthase RsuA-like enzyme
MIVKTRVFELARGKYRNVADLATAMGLSVSQLYRVREGKRSINQKFIIGAKKAFSEYRLDELFYLDSGQESGYASKTSGTTRRKRGTR